MQGGGGGGGGTPPTPLTITDVANFRNTSSDIAALEVGAGITSANFPSFVFMSSTGSETTPNRYGTGFKIYIYETQTKEEGMLSYAHELTNAKNINQIWSLINTAKTNPKTDANRTAYADGMAAIEAQGVIMQVLVAVNISRTDLLDIPQDVYDKITAFLRGQATALETVNKIVQWIKSGAVKDDAGNSIYQGYINYYNSIP